MPEKTPEQFAVEIARAERQLPEARAQLRRIPGVIDVLVGIKETRGLATEHVVFQVYVERKKSTAELVSADRIPAAILGIPTDVIGRTRIDPHDVLCGGMKLTQSLWGVSNGTLGVICLATAANTHAPEQTPLVLTNHHVASSIGDRVGIGCLCDSWCCECCDIGTLVDAALTDHVDGSIATLNGGVRFSHDILAVGAIRGHGVATKGMPVVKYGDTSGFTHGVVTQDNEPTFTRSDGATFVGQIRVAPTAPDTVMSRPGDSGSVYVEEATRRIVGLHHAGSDGISFGNHIADVMARLNIVFPVTGTAGAVPVGGIPLVEYSRGIERALALRRDWEGTEFGRQWSGLIRLHSSEVRHLVNHHRAAKVAWQRCQGPAFLAHFLKSVREPTHRVPREIAGTRVENAIVSMAAVFRQYGSPALADAVTEHYLTVLACAERAESADEAMANFHRFVGGVPLKGVPRAW
ncbi:MAG: hypothetical protein P0111_14390 [Nitrospira sp.]|nr:hypothetical protein [Nitrospira sp.]